MKKLPYLVAWSNARCKWDKRTFCKGWTRPDWEFQGDTLPSWATHWGWRLDGHTVVDIDTRLLVGPKLREALDAADTYVVKTVSGGYHFYFRGENTGAGSMRFPWGDLKSGRKHGVVAAGGDGYVVFNDAPMAPFSSVGPAIVADGGGVILPDRPAFVAGCKLTDGRWNDLRYRMYRAVEDGIDLDELPGHLTECHRLFHEPWPSDDLACYERVRGLVTAFGVALPRWEARDA